MPYILQEEIDKAYPHQTGSEAFDSMYQLYKIFHEPSYFLINLFFGANEQLNLENILSFLKSATQKYHVSHWVVRCKQQTENHPVEAVAFANIFAPENIQKCTQYILTRLNQGYDCIVHEVITGQYPSNRLDWLYSFGICYKDSLPQIEIYPATDASSIKWGKLTPLDFISLDKNLTPSHTKIRSETALITYQQTKINEWIQLFAKEIPDTFAQKKLFTTTKSLSKLLKDQHPLFNITKVDEAIQKTKDTLIKIALQYSMYAQHNQIDPDQTIVHGSLLFNYRIIVWDISTDKRWQHLKSK